MSSSFLSAFLGGLLGGGLVSAVISSPQTQTIYWIKEPEYRWNIILWDSVAFAAVMLVIGIALGKKKFFLIAGIGFAIGILISWYLKKKYSQDFLLEV